jgi:hypothetical protein
LLTTYSSGYRIAANAVVHFTKTACSVAKEDAVAGNAYVAPGACQMVCIVGIEKPGLLKPPQWSAVIGVSSQRIPK